MFERVPHGKILLTLQHIGLPIIILKWIKVHLLNRKLFVDVSGVLSEPLHVISDVPQGSVLVPLLLLIYVNALVSIVDKRLSIRPFADDCIIYKDVSSVDDQLLLNSSLFSTDYWWEEMKETK